MPTDAFSLSVITKAVLCQAIQAAQERVIFAAPGVDESVAHALAQAYEKLQEDSVYVHIDPSARALRAGYGTAKGVEILAHLRKAFVAETWRLGLLIADDEASIYSPLAEAKERPAAEGDEPNGVILRGIAVDYLAEGIRGPAERPLLAPENTTAADSEESGGTGQPRQTRDTTVPAPKIPNPRDSRLMDLVRRTFKIVEFHHSLTFADKRIHLTARDFGIRTKEVDPLLSISFRVIGDADRKEINKIMNGFEREIEKWTKGGMLRTPLPRLQVVWYAEPQEFETEFAEVKRTIEDRARKWFTEHYAQVQAESARIVERFLNDDLYERVRPDRQPSQRELSEAEFRKQWVDAQAKRYQLPSAKEAIDSLKFDFELHDISAELFARSEFRHALEKEFGVDLEEMLDREERRTVPESGSEQGRLFQFDL